MSEYPSTRRARSLRRRANAPEQKAWETLRQLRAEGYTVRRQVLIEGLTVDFAIRSLRLVIEIDGAIHDIEAVRQNDVERDARLRSAGWQVLRVPAETAMSGDHLIAVVRGEIAKRLEE
jgi:very-short-patch-repair endonuclease